MINRDLKKGDVVSVRAVVKHDQNGDEYVHLRIGGEFKPTVTVDLENIIAFIEPKIDVEDVVRRIDDPEQGGTVRAVWNAGGTTVLWVENPRKPMATWIASDVEIVEPVAAVPPPAPPES